MTKVCIVLVASAALLMGAPARGEEARSHELALELLEAMNVPGQMKDGYEAFGRLQAQFLRDAARQGGANADQNALVAAVQKEMMGLLEEEMSWEKTKDELAAAYVSSFTDDEMRGLIDFYRSPLGRTLVAKGPALAEKTMAITQARTQALMPRIQQLLMERMQVGNGG